MIDKQASPKGKTVRVTFSLPADAASEAVAVVGEFNGWDAGKGVMRLDRKAGAWTKGVSLKPGTSYQFRYLVDGKSWRNDESADAFVPNEFFSENGVVKL
jgi:1,4-alpha-glucan branching enzyme